MLVELHTAMQVIVMCLSITSFMFYSYNMWEGKTRVDWQVIYVVGVECFLYALLLSVPADYQYLHGTTPLFRYSSWLTTCPVLLSNLIVLFIDNVSFKIVAAPIILELWTTIFGMLSASYTGSMKAVFFVCGATTCMLMYMIIVRISNMEEAKVGPLYEEKKRLMYFLLVTWVIFPILFSLGPEMTGTIDGKTSAMYHAIGDLLSKNLMGFLFWSLGKAVEEERVKLAEGKGTSSPSDKVSEVQMEEASWKPTKTIEATAKLAPRPTASPPRMSADFIDQIVARLQERMVEESRRNTSETKYSPPDEMTPVRRPKIHVDTSTVLPVHTRPHPQSAGHHSGGHETPPMNPPRSMSEGEQLANQSSLAKWWYQK